MPFQVEIKKYEQIVSVSQEILILTQQHAEQTRVALVLSEQETIGLQQAIDGCQASLANIHAYLQQALHPADRANTEQKLHATLSQLAILQQALQARQSLYSQQHTQYLTKTQEVAAAHQTLQQNQAHLQGLHQRQQRAVEIAQIEAQIARLRGTPSSRASSGSDDLTSDLQRKPSRIGFAPEPEKRMQQTWVKQQKRSPVVMPRAVLSPKPPEEVVRERYRREETARMSGGAPKSVLKKVAKSSVISSSATSYSSSSPSSSSPVSAVQQLLQAVQQQRVADVKSLVAQPGAIHLLTQALDAHNTTLLHVAVNFAETPESIAILRSLLSIVPSSELALPRLSSQYRAKDDKVKGGESPLMLAMLQHRSLFMRCYFERFPALANYDTFEYSSFTLYSQLEPALMINLLAHRYPRGHRFEGKEREDIVKVLFAVIRAGDIDTLLHLVAIDKTLLDEQETRHFTRLVESSTGRGEETETTIKGLLAIATEASDNAAGMVEALLQLQPWSHAALDDALKGLRNEPLRHLLSTYQANPRGWRSITPVKIPAIPTLTDLLSELKQEAHKLAGRGECQPSAYSSPRVISIASGHPMTDSLSASTLQSTSGASSSSSSYASSPVSPPYPGLSSPGPERASYLIAASSPVSQQSKALPSSSGFSFGSPSVPFFSPSPSSAPPRPPASLTSVAVYASTSGDLPSTPVPVSAASANPGSSPPSSPSLYPILSPVASPPVMSELPSHGLQPPSELLRQQDALIAAQRKSGANAEVIHKAWSNIKNDVVAAIEACKTATEMQQLALAYKAVIEKTSPDRPSTSTPGHVAELIKARQQQEAAAVLIAPTYRR